MKHALSMALLLGAAGCSGQTGELWGGGCTPHDAVPEYVPFDDATAVGFSGQDVVDTIGTWAGPLSWADGQVTTADLRLEELPSEVLTFGDAAGVDCVQMTFEAKVALTTEDGRLAESWPVEIAAVSSVDADMTMARGCGVLQGELDVAALVPEGFPPSTCLELDGHLDEHGAHGEITVLSDSTEGDSEAVLATF